jgi:hypothetical protein
MPEAKHNAGSACCLDASGGEPSLCSFVHAPQGFSDFLLDQLPVYFIMPWLRGLRRLVVGS